MLDGLKRIRWDTYRQPGSNDSQTVAQAIAELSECDPESASEVYSRFLYAIGNNHAGTYFPVVIPTIGFLHVILQGQNEAAVVTTLEVLIDLLGSFCPDATEEPILEEHDRFELEVQLQNEAQRLRPALIAIADSETRLETTASLAREVVDLLGHAPTTYA